MEQSAYLSTLFTTAIWPYYELSLKRDRTRRDYFRYVNNLCEYCGCDFLVVDEAAAQSYFRHLEQDEHSYTPKSLHSRLSALRSVATFIEKNRVRWELDTYINPYANIVIASYTDNLHINDLPTPKQIDQLLSSAAEDAQMYLILLLVLRCGLSVSEICNLKPSYIRQDDTGRFFLEIIKNNGNLRRNVKIPSDILPTLLTYCASCSNDKTLFFSRKGQPLQIRTLQMYFRELVEQSGLKRSFTLQDVRHAAIAYMRKGGAEASSVASYTGISERWIYRYNGVLDDLTDAPCDYGIVQVRT